MKIDERISKEHKERIEEKIALERTAKEMEAVREIIEFNKTPSELKAEIDRFVIGQDQGKKIISTAIAFHYRRLGQALQKWLSENDANIDVALRHTVTPKANIMIIGPTGCGKTYSSETASKLVGVSFVHEDMTRFSEVGYVGQNVSDILLDLLMASGGHPSLAQMGIVYIDEVDKIATEATAYKDVSGRGVQKGLLHLVDGSENTLEIGKERLSLSTKHVLFIAGGAFEDLDVIVKKRIARQEVNGNWRNYLMADDLVAFGMERQLIGRFPVRVVYDRLTTQDLKDILTKSEDSALLAYTNDLKAWGIDLEVTDDALTEVARRAEQEGTGARGLISVLHRVLLEDLFRLPGTYTGKFIVDRSYVEERLG
ncbi:MAG: AAA family ATPase [Desulforhabdus sp.]|jgi:ATP-dependent Clp protease ATP-binding subunit ClpX|nr:AAA family ATPase [Desulforhabdus sp.]